MNYELAVYLVIAVLSFIIGLLAGYLATGNYYHRRFVSVAEQCEKDDSIVPIIKELERES